MAFYKKMYNSKTKVYYPMAVTVGNPVETKEVAEELALISTVSKSDVAAVLADLAAVMAKMMKQGKSVRLEGLGTFRYTLDTKGVADEADFDFDKQVKGVRVQFTPQREGNTTRGETITRGLVAKDIEWISVGEGVETGSPSQGGGSGSDGGEDDNPIG